jgi:hypothetical protein
MNVDDQSDSEQQSGMVDEASNDDDDYDDDDGDDDDDAHPDRSSSGHTTTRRNTPSVHHLLGGSKRRSMNADGRCYSKQQTMVDDDASNDDVGDDDSDGDLIEDGIDREHVGIGSSSPGITPTISRPDASPPPSTSTRLPPSSSASSSSSGDATHYFRRMFRDADTTRGDTSSSESNNDVSSPPVNLLDDPAVHSNIDPNGIAIHPSLGISSGGVLGQIDNGGNISSVGSNVSHNQGLDTEMVISTTIGQPSTNRLSSTSSIPIRTPLLGASSSGLGAAMEVVSNSLSVHRRTRSATRNGEDEPMDISNRS